MATATNHSTFSDGKYVVALMLTSILLLASTLLLAGASMVLIARMLLYFCFDAARSNDITARSNARSLRYYGRSLRPSTWVLGRFDARLGNFSCFHTLDRFDDAAGRPDARSLR
jgi:hypothetical protein